jgi:hypothetical protein
MKRRRKLSADALQDVLWETLQDLREDNIEYKAADSIASQSREICRIAKLQLEASKLTGRKPTQKSIKSLCM